MKHITTNLGVIEDTDLAQLLVDLEGLVTSGWKLVGPIQMTVMPLSTKIKYLATVIKYK